MSNNTREYTKTTRRDGRGKRIEYSPEKMAMLMAAAKEAGIEGAERYRKIIGDK